MAQLPLLCRPRWTDCCSNLLQALMKFHDTLLKDARLIDLDLIRDVRGFFARSFCEHEFLAEGLETRFLQHSTSFSARKYTLRGMHFQREPHGEVKLVRCLRGIIWDVIVDIRPTSPTFRQWQGFELSAENRQQLYIPRGFAHGFQTLCDDVEVGYMINAVEAPEAASGFRYDDPAFEIDWPLPVTVISKKDQSWPKWAP
jgi:dTDP-4-dehydrorhamnose 3,5-epimerase